MNKTEKLKKSIIKHSKSKKNIFPYLKKLKCKSQKSTSSSNSCSMENSNNLELNFMKLKNFHNFEKNKLNFFLNEDKSIYSYNPFKNIKNKNENNLNYEKAENALKEINSQLNDMNYCNNIQTNFLQRLDLSLSFLSSEIENLKLLNKKRKIKLQQKLDQFKNLDVNK